MAGGHAGHADARGARGRRAEPHDQLDPPLVGSFDATATSSPTLLAAYHLYVGDREAALALVATLDDHPRAPAAQVDEARSLAAPRGQRGGVVDATRGRARARRAVVARASNSGGQSGRAGERAGAAARRRAARGTDRRAPQPELSDRCARSCGERRRGAVGRRGATDRARSDRAPPVDGAGDARAPGRAAVAATRSPAGHRGGPSGRDQPEVPGRPARLDLGQQRPVGAARGRAQRLHARAGDRRARRRRSLGGARRDRTAPRRRRAPRAARRRSGRSTSGSRSPPTRPRRPRCSASSPARTTTSSPIRSPAISRCPTTRSTSSSITRASRSATASGRRPRSRRPSRRCAS